jgi:hypothetical protein
MGCVGLIVGAALLWGGGQGLYTSLRNRAPEATTCSELVSGKPDAEWLELSGCEYDLSELSYAMKLTTVSEVFVPLIVAGAEDGTTTPILLASKDASLLALAKTSEDDAGPDELFEKLAAVETPAKISGLVRFGIELDDDDVKQLRELNPGLPEDFVLLAHDEKPPSAVLALLAFLGGFVVLGAMGFSALRNAGDDEDDVEEDAPWPSSKVSEPWPGSSEPADDEPAADAPAADEPAADEPAADAPAADEPAT